jgi:hypothetical protein
MRTRERGWRISAGARLKHLRSGWAAGTHACVSPVDRVLLRRIWMQLESQLLMLMSVNAKSSKGKRNLNQQ